MNWSCVSLSSTYIYHPFYLSIKAFYESIIKIMLVQLNVVSLVCEIELIYITVIFCVMSLSLWHNQAHWSEDRQFTCSFTSEDRQFTRSFISEGRQDYWIICAR